MVRSTKGSVPQGNEDRQEEMTVVVLKLKGGGDTLRKGFDALSSAFALLGPGAVLTKRVPIGPSKQLNGSLAEQASDEEEPVLDEEPVAIDAAPASFSAPARTPAQRKPKFLTEFDLNAGATSWKDFAGSRAPKNDNEKYLLAALWITEEAKLPDFSVSHVFTCFRAMKWSEQVDFSQPMRQMKHRDSYFSHPTPRTWKLTQPGLDAARGVKEAGAP
jgi:hypothetical protein